MITTPIGIAVVGYGYWGPNLARNIAERGELRLMGLCERDPARGMDFARRYPGWEVCVFGHVGDGNLHVNVMKPDAMEKAEFLAKTHEADRDLFDLVKKHAGSISAEHGIGLLKKAWLPWTRSEADRALMRAIKTAVDPAGIFNPGKIFD